MSGASSIILNVLGINSSEVELKGQPQYTTLSLHKGQAEQHKSKEVIDHHFRDEHVGLCHKMGKVPLN